MKTEAMFRNVGVPALSLRTTRRRDTGDAVPHQRCIFLGLPVRMALGGFLFGTLSKFPELPSVINKRRERQRQEAVQICFPYVLITHKEQEMQQLQ
jgi:hypothetical protein